MDDRSRVTDAYLTKLGLRREAPSMALLTEIARRHVATFSFASLGPRLGDELPLDLASLFDRIVIRKRGGYCFEQNGLAFEVLAELGFQVTLQMARVLLNQDVHPGLTHRTTLVDIEGGRYLVDVGFGSMGPRLPVSLAGDASPPAHHPFWIAEKRPGDFHLQTLKDGAPWTLYRFEQVPYGQADCELGHFWSHRYPKANFVNHLVVARKFDDEIRSLRNGDYRIRRGASESEHAIASAADLKRILTEDFDLSVTDAECGKLFAELPSPVPAP